MPLSHRSKLNVSFSEPSASVEYDPSSLKGWTVTCDTPECTVSIIILYVIMYSARFVNCRFQRKMLITPMPQPSLNMTTLLASCLK